MQRCFFCNSPIYKFREWRLAWTPDDDDPWRSQIARHCGFVLKQIDLKHLKEIVRPTAEALLIESYVLTLPLHCTLNQRDGGIDYIDSSNKQPIKSASGKIGRVEVSFLNLHAVLISAVWQVAVCLGPFWQQLAMKSWSCALTMAPYTREDEFQQQS